MDSEPCSDEPTDTALEVDSSELALCGRVLVGEFDANASKPKNDQRLDVFVGLGVGDVTGADTLAISMSAGIEFRRLGDVVGVGSSKVRSRTAPAVLGRESFKSRVGLRDNKAGLFLPFGSLGELREINDDILPVTEWPGVAVMVLEVSLETRESGLGMNSRVSEKPTRALGAGLASLLSKAGGASGLDSSGASGSSTISTAGSGSGGVGGSR
jgi:hypothetical protein